MEELTDINRVDKVGVDSITDVKVVIQTGEHKVTGFFPDFMSTYRAVHSWSAEAERYHGKVMPINITFTAGSKRMGGVYQPDFFIFGQFVTWVAETIKKQGVLSSVSLNRPAEIHVSWDYLDHYLVIRRPIRKGGNCSWRSRRYGFLPGHQSSRGKLILMLDGYDWTFSFEDEQSERHYYSGELKPIHHELLRSALDVYTIVDNDNDVHQSSALYGLEQFYKQYPDMISQLNDFYLRLLAQSAKPGKNPWVGKQALSLLKFLGADKTNEHVKGVAREVDAWLRAFKSEFGIASSELVDSEGA